MPAVEEIKVELEQTPLKVSMSQSKTHPTSVPKAASLADRLRGQLDNLDALFRQAGVFDAENRICGSMRSPEALLREFEASMTAFKAEHASEKLAAAELRLKQVPHLCRCQAETIFKDQAPISWPDDEIIWIAASTELKARFLTHDCYAVAEKQLKQVSERAAREWERTWTRRIISMRTLSREHDIAKVAASPLTLLAKFKSAMAKSGHSKKRPRDNTYYAPRTHAKHTRKELNFEDECLSDDILCRIDIP